MATEKTILYFGHGRSEPIALARRFAGDNGLRVTAEATADGVRAQLNRTFPACLMLDTEAGSEAEGREVLELVYSNRQ